MKIYVDSIFENGCVGEVENHGKIDMTLQFMGKNLAHFQSQIKASEAGKRFVFDLGKYVILFSLKRDLQHAVMHIIDYTQFRSMDVDLSDMRYSENAIKTFHKIGDKVLDKKNSDLDKYQITDEPFFFETVSHN